MLSTRRKKITFSELASAWNGYLARNTSAGTQRKYAPVAQRFASGFAGRTPSSIATSEIEAFLAEWETETSGRIGRRLSEETRRNRITALRAFFSYLEDHDHLVDRRGHRVANPMTRVRMPRRVKKQINYLTDAEDRALLACRGTQQEEIVVWLLRWTGVRVGEARALRIRDVDLASGREQITVTNSKTPNGIREIPLVPEMVTKIRQWFEYLDGRGQFHPNAPLLPTIYGTPLQATFIWRVVKRMAARANVRRIDCTCGSGLSDYHSNTCPTSANGQNRSEVTPHTLRRTFATHLRKQNVPLDHISQLLGHTSVAVTNASYAAVLPNDVRQSMLTAYQGLKAA